MFSMTPSTFHIQQEAAASFKKVKKKVRKIRKKEVLKADDLLPLPEESTNEDFGSRYVAEYFSSSFCGSKA